MDKIILIRNTNFVKFDKKDIKFFFGKYKRAKINKFNYIKKDFKSKFLFTKYIISILYTIFFIFTFNFHYISNIYKT